MQSCPALPPLKTEARLSLARRNRPQRLLRSANDQRQHHQQQRARTGRKGLPQPSRRTNSKQKSPNKMDESNPASVSTARLTAFAKRLPRLAYSVRKIAAPVPIGIAGKRTATIIKSVFQSAGSQKPYADNPPAQTSRRLHRRAKTHAPKLRTSLPDKKPDHQQRDRAAHQCTAERRCMQQRRDPFLPHSASLSFPRSSTSLFLFPNIPPILFYMPECADISAYIAACVCPAAPHCSHLSYDRCLRHAFSLFLLLPRGFFAAVQILQQHGCQIHQQDPHKKAPHRR